MPFRAARLHSVPVRVRGYCQLRAEPTLPMRDI